MAFISPRPYPHALLFHFSVFLICLALVLLCGKTGRAQNNPFGFDSSLNAYTEEPYSHLPLLSVRSRTRIAGPLARTRVTYTFADGLKQNEEVGLNFHLPPGAVLNGFGYFYGTRFIRGRIYSNDEAWKIYTAVTSRGRDPGIMDRPTQQDYHTQIYPVLPGQALRVVIDLTQMLPTDAQGAHFTLPLQQEATNGGPVQVNAEVDAAGHVTDFASADYAGRVVKTQHVQGAVLRLRGRGLPHDNWQVTVRRGGPGVQAASFSALPLRGGGSGAYAATVSVPFPLQKARITVHGAAGTDHTLPTAFGATAAYSSLSFVGRYRHAGPAYVTVRSSHHKPFTVRLFLGGRRMPDPQNPAARLWADKRIAALQDDTRHDRKSEVVALSRRYTIVSRFTALLAIPTEELQRYRQRLARHEIDTNTRDTGGGGGDPYIRVRAPQDALRVVAVFPNGDAKELTFNAESGVWDGRFDIPFGTPEGEYRVCVLVVHKDGQRTQFVLTYRNSLTGPRVLSDLSTLRARPGGPLDIRIAGEGVARAFAVTPWGERVDLSAEDNAWMGRVTVPTAWPTGDSAVTVVLLDGAHNKTEVPLDLHVE